MKENDIFCKICRISELLRNLDEKGKEEMCSKKSVYEIHGPAGQTPYATHVPGYPSNKVEYIIPGEGCTHTCTCDKSEDNEPLDYTRDEFSHLMSMLMQIREYINLVGEKHGDFIVEDDAALTQAHTMEKQLLNSLQSYVTDATN
jgi:hypothetical protein